MDYKKSLTCLALSMAALSVSAQSQTVTGKIETTTDSKSLAQAFRLKARRALALFPTSTATLLLKPRTHPRTCSLSHTLV